MQPLPNTASYLDNTLLRGLPQAEWEQLRPGFTRVRLVIGQVLLEQGQVNEHVFFPEEGLASLVMRLDTDGKGVQVAMVGREGMVGGLAVLDGVSAAVASTVMQVPGPALRIPVAVLEARLATCPALKRGCLRFVRSLMHQMMHAAATNARGGLTERCVRWLLMAQERLDQDEIMVTHEGLAALLGVRRSGVTVTMIGLEQKGLVRNRRGRVTLVDRAGLQRMLPGGKPPTAFPLKLDGTGMAASGA